MTQVIVTLARERETKSKVVFTNATGPLGSVYLDKLADYNLGSPEAIVVTVEPLQ